jgi:hypothetical protein
MRSLLRVCIACLLASSLPAAAAESAVSLAALRSHLDFLASDALEGRDTGTRGYEIAALYAAAQFRQSGLAPGNGESYFQQVPLTESKLDSSSLEIVSGGMPTALVWKEDYVLSARAGHPQVEIETPVVFAGFGIDAPESGRADYAGVDVTGKIVLVLTGAPADFPSEQRAHYASSRQKRIEAARRGAVGLVTLRTRDDERRSPWERSVLNADRPSMTWRHPDGTPVDDSPGLRVTAGLSHAGAGKLLVGATATLEELLDLGEAGGRGSRELGVTLRAAVRSTLRELESPNVVALLTGAEPARRDEIVVFTAHLDHVGVGAEVDGDAIYNGYYDNAMGSAVVLEVARALARSPRPARSVAFVLVTGEERGLLGSDFFAQHPSFAGARVVADLNVDMPLFLHPVADLVAFGAEHTTLGELARAAAEANGFVLTPDPEPEESIFVRSDQYSFVRQGIPAIYLCPGHGSRVAGENGGAAVESFRREHYHRPSDEGALPTDWDGVVRFAAVHVELTRAAANADEPPRWLAGSFFGELFGGADAP